MECEKVCILNSDYHLSWIASTMLKFGFSILAIGYAIGEKEKTPFDLTILKLSLEALFSK